MKIENEENDFSEERFSFKSINQKSPQDLFEKNLGAELRKKAYAFEETYFSNSALNSNNKNHHENKSSFSKKFNNKVKEKNYLIKNPEVIQIIIKFTQTTNLRFSYKFLIEINELICLNSFNCFVLYNNELFLDWLRELIFSAFLIHNKNLSEENKRSQIAFANCEANLHIKELHALFMLGKKLFAKIILEISVNFDFDELSKMLNSLFNWAIHLKHFRNLEYEEIELTSFVFELLEEIFFGLKERYDFNIKKFQEAFNNVFYLNLELININSDGNNNNNKIGNFNNKISNDTLKILKENYFSESKLNLSSSQADDSKNSLYSGMQISNLLNYQNNFSISIMNFINFGFFFYEFLTFFNISKNPFVCIKSLDYENVLRNSANKTQKIPDVIRQNNLFHILRVFQKEKSLFNENENKSIDKEESIKDNAFQCDLGLQRNFNKLFHSLNSFNKSFIDVISSVWKNNILNPLFEKNKNKECYLMELINQEKIDLLIQDYVMEKETKNCFLNSLSVLFMEFSLDEKEKELNDFSGFNSRIRDNNHNFPSEENCFKLGLLNEEFKFKIKALLNINIKGDLNVYNSLNIKEKVVKTRETYMRSKKSFYIEYDKVIKEMNSSIEFADELSNYNNSYNKDKVKKQKSLSKNPSELKEAKPKSIYLIQIINSIIILKLENLSEEFYSNCNENNKNANKENYLDEIKKETIYYLEEYQRFLLFLCFASSNMKSKNNTNYELYSSEIIEIMLYSIIYIYDSICYSNQAELLNNNFIQYNYSILFKNFFGAMLSIYEKIQEKKRKKSFMNKLIPKKSNQDLMICAVFRIINDYLSIQIPEQEKNRIEKRQLTSIQFIKDFQKTEIKFLVELLKSYEFDILLLHDKDFIRKRSESNFDLDGYLNILAYRTKSAENSKPVDLNFIFRNYRATNFFLYNISRNTSEIVNSTAYHKSRSVNVISKKLKPEEDKSNHSLSAQNLNNLNFLTSNTDNFGLFYHEGLKRNLFDIEKNFTKFYYKRKFEDVNLINRIKNLKYKLFTWCGLWAEKEMANCSDSNILKSERFKWKVMNHNTKFFYKPLLKAIIDFPIHFPENSKFDADVLFLEEVKNTMKKSQNMNSQKPEFTYENETAVIKIKKKFKKNEQLDIDKLKASIKQFLSSIEINQLMQNNLRSNFNLWKHFQKLNCILDKITNLTSDINDQVNQDTSINRIPEANDKKDDSVHNILESIYDLEQFKDIYNIFEVCLVKLTSHIKSFLKFTSTGFDIFTNFPTNYNQELNLDFDKNKGENCFGSFIRPSIIQHLSSKFYRNFSFEKVHFIFKRNYYLTNSAVEIFTNNQSYYINFINKEERKKFLRIVKANLNKLRKLKIEVNSCNNANQKENVFGFPDSKNKDNNSSDRESNKLTSFNSSLTLTVVNNNESNLRKLNSNDIITLGIKPLTAKNICNFNRKEKNKKRKHETIGYENLAIANSFCNVFKKEKKSKKANYKSFTNNNNNNNNNSEKEFFKSIKVDKIIEYWSENSSKYFSNFELLLLLNMLANRSFTDVTQYPVFPWIISDYQNQNFRNNFNDKNRILTQIDQANKKKSLRDLSCPIGLLTDYKDNSAGENRKNSYLNIYQSMLEDYQAGESTQTPYFYGSLYSNIIYVAHYLIRLFPFTKLAVEFQGGKFDCYARTFKSIADSFYNASSLTGDVRELVPEFFFMPEILQNLNNLNLNRKYQKNINFDNNNSNNNKNNNNNNDENCNNNDGKSFNYDVSLPFWCEGNSINFIVKHKEILESPDVSSCLGDWIDLIFGFAQAGKNAVKAKNVYFDDAYLINNPSFDLNVLSDEDRNLKLKFIEFGLIPRQIINSKIPNNIVKNTLKETQQPIRKNLKIEFNLDKKEKDNRNRRRIFSFSEIGKFRGDFKRTIILLKMRFVQDNNSLICLFNNNCIYQIIFPSLSNKEFLDFYAISEKFISENLRFKENYDFESTFAPFSLKMPEFYEEDKASNSQKVIYISKNGKVKNKKIKLFPLSYLTYISMLLKEAIIMEKSD